MTALGTTASPRVRSARTRLGVVVTALLVVTAGVNLLYLIGLIASGGENNVVVGVGLGLATQWIPATVFWLVAVQTRFRRLPVVLAAAGITLSSLGDTYYALAMDADGYLASPSPADPAYLLFYPLLVAALISLVRAQLRGVGRLLLLETAVGTVGASAVLAVALDPVIRDALAGGDPLASAVALSYPLFDLMLLAVIAGIAAAPTIRLGRRWWALIAGLFVTAVGDVAYALLGSVGTYLAGTPLDATWAVGLALMAWWVAGMDEPETSSLAASPRRVALPVPALAVVAGLAVLVIATQVPVSLLAVVLAALTVGLGTAPIVFRQAMLGRMLAAQEEAVRRLTALDRAKTDIMVTMNHEFRTPLTTINGHVDLLLDGAGGQLSPAAVGMLEKIERSGERLQALLDETLTASQFEEGRDQLVRVPLELDGLVAEVVDRAASHAQARGVRLEIDDLEDVRVEADAAHLGRALAAVVENAVKFTPERGHVRVSLVPGRDGRDAVVRVADEGIGIPASDLPSVFDRYFRASNVQNAAIPGVGLGLSIARHVVRAHDGTIDVASSLDAGTVVTVTLPAAR